MKYPALAHHRSLLVARLVAYAVAANGIAIIATPIVISLFVRFGFHLYASRFTFDAQLVLALSLVYLSALLRRRKRTAWLVTLGVYITIFAINTTRYFLTDLTPSQLKTTIITNFILPIIIVAMLLLSRRVFVVKSDISTFAFSLRITLFVMVITFVYGVSGFMVMDTRDFHHEIGLGEAIHRTIDQFDLTTDHALMPHTFRAKAFMDSLSALSTVAVIYSFVSLFQPLRARFVDQSHLREIAEDILSNNPASSEDFFKTWPHDKLYFFNATQTAGLAYTTRFGTALVVGDPMGDSKDFDDLLESFDVFCETNDWSVAFIHTEPKFSNVYKRHDFSMQKIGEEAVLDISHFIEETSRDKYFRQIYNRFTKQGYSVEVLPPPHSDALLNRLQHISNDWINRPGRKERTFMMGYFSFGYLQKGPVAVLRDDAGTIQAFINQIPTFDKNEANFDMLRGSKDAMGNANDFILLEFIKHLHAQGIPRLNLGLCPLSGLDSPDEQEGSVTNNALRFLYANGDRFYSFNGLKKFKAKYDPKWHGRYIAYRGGIRGFTKVLNALNRAMRV